ncbi:hypothetical protein LCER1_G006740 [Lachnellula cervina]|uniref:BTB domain-containing protein n=1 Tax=Lachnellula cervina TaxID=1316786 RepID=A0A7D8YM25_9HELO|nr:hypothetical protein LCER1_G006740 [Lachnellula cervina]
MASQGTKRKCEDEVLPFKKRMGTQMVNIYVGKGDAEEHFTVHKELLCNKIPYFEKMFKGGFQEATTNEARFPEDTPASFDMMLDWVYERSLPPVVYSKGEGFASSASWDCTELYVLCDKLCIPELMDKVMDIYRKFNMDSNTLSHESEIRAVYSRTAPGSPIRRYVAYTCAWTIIHGCADVWNIEVLEDLITTVPDLARDVIRIMRETGGKIENPSKGPNCDFHTHQKDIPCPWKRVKKAKRTS